MGVLVLGTLLFDTIIRQEIIEINTNINYPDVEHFHSIELSGYGIHIWV